MSSHIERISDSGRERATDFGHAMEDTRKHVLVVDDNNSVRESLALLLRMAGYRVSEAYCGADALDQLRTDRPDLLVTDMKMPGMHGCDLIRAIRESGPDVSGMRIIALSVHGPKELEAAISAGADATVDKLADFEVLLGSARSLLHVSARGE